MQTAHSSVAPPPSRRRTIFLPRVDLYGPVHKGLRWAMARLLVRLGNTPVTNMDEQQAVLDDLQMLIVMLAKHAAHEESFIHPELEKRRPGMTQLLTAAHQDHERFVGELRVLESALRIASPETRVALRRALYLRFSAFASEQLAHMLDEEEIVQPLLEDLFVPEELEAIHAKLMASLTPDELIASLRIMLPALDRDERLELLAAPKKAMPSDAFGPIFAVARACLGDADFDDLSRRL